MKRSAAYLVLFASLLFAVPGVAATTPSADEAAWPPPPPPDEFDWIQLTSGEWLKGEFRVLYDDSVEFDSDNLGLLNIDWADIKQIRGHATHSIHVEGRPQVVGNLQMVDDRLTVVSADDEVTEIERKDVVSIAHGKPRERNYWSAKLSFGMNISEGNSDRRDLNINLNTKRRTADSRFITDYLGYYAESQGIKTDDNHRLTSTYDIFRTRQFFWRPLLGQFFRDPFQNIAYQVTVGAGAGYQIIDTAKTEWDVAGGPGFKYTRFEEVEPGESDTESTPVIWLGTNYEHALNSKMDLILGYSTITGNKASGGYTHHAVATLETELLSWLDFDTSLIWDHTQYPTANADGTVPEKDDFRFVIGLGLEY